MDNEMQRNLVLACVLMVVITVGYSLLMQRMTPQQPPSGPESTPVAQVEEPQQKADRPSAAEKPPTPQPQVDVHEEDDHILVIAERSLEIKSKFALRTRIRKRLLERGIRCDVLIQSQQELQTNKELPGHIVRSALRDGVPL